MKVCLITMAKDEDSHIDEFLEHYFNIVGIDHIFWIDNNTEPLKPVQINDDRVTIVDRRNVNFDSGEKTPLFIMRDVLNEVYQEYVVNSEYDWCLYFDPDELLDINGKNIQEYINNIKDYDVSLVPWVLHGNNNYIFESELPSDRMKINYGYSDNYAYTKIEYKPIFKINKDFYIDIFFFNPTMIIRNADDNKIKIDNSSKLHHYRIQCIETYIKHKIKNGFYGYENRAEWCKNIFSSSQFSDSNVKILPDKFISFYELLKKYDIYNLITEQDKFYLHSKFGMIIY